MKQKLNKVGLVLSLLIIYLLCNTYLRRTTDRAFDFLIGRKHSRKDRQVKVSFREVKAQVYWPTTDQKVRGSNPFGRTNRTMDLFELISVKKDLLTFLQFQVYK